ncbi:hypothetical protein AB0D73_29355 [Streptomyces sp. NPDC048215]|uniref:hypothetical protein n=1 Tax=Streptomyces sp. NPDC048215 TaxID=3156690 RepID=UPI0034111864
MRSRVVTITLPPELAKADYPEFEEVRAEGVRRGRGPIDPQALRQMEEVAARRGDDWCTAVIGRSFAGIRYVSCAESFMLLVADERGLEPPLPQRYVEARRLFDERREQDRARRAEQGRLERERWEAAVRTCLVKVSVRPNLNRGGRRSMPHVVPDVPVRSSRGVHPAGRALCEHWRNPRQLGDPIPDGVATCQSCVRYAAEIRSMNEPAPPTAAERALLQLIAEGSVFTMTHARRAPAARVVNEPSRGAGGGLGRSVNAAVSKLEAKQWAVVDQAHSPTPSNTFGYRWRLTAAGAAALGG